MIRPASPAQPVQPASAGQSPTPTLLVCQRAPGSANFDFPDKPIYQGPPSTDTAPDTKRDWPVGAHLLTRPRSPQTVQTPSGRVVAMTHLKSFLKANFINTHRLAKLIQRNEGDLHLAMRIISDLGLGADSGDAFDSTAESSSNDKKRLDRLINRLFSQRPNLKSQISRLCFSGLDTSYSQCELDESALQQLADRMRSQCRVVRINNQLPVDMNGALYNFGRPITDADRLALLTLLYEDILVVLGGRQEHTSYNKDLAEVVRLLVRDLQGRTRAYKELFPADLGQLGPQEREAAHQRQLVYEQIFFSLSYDRDINPADLLEHYGISDQEHTMLIQEWNRRVASGMIDASIDEDTRVTRGAALENYRPA